MLRAAVSTGIQPVVSITEDLPRSISLDEISGISERASAMLEDAREKMSAPHPRKVAPVYSLAQVAALCRMEKSQANYIVTNKSDGVPSGTIVGNNRKREFTLAEAQAWIAQYAPFGARPAGLRGKKLAIGNFKGGVTKTTTAMALAQGLSLRGRRVLLIDLDPQASLTTLHGILADSEVAYEHTIMPLIYGEADTLEYAVQPTYWAGIDLIPASGMLAGAEFHLPMQQAQNTSFEFWDVINKGLEPLLDKYDIIIFDTPPALSYLTINALMAADGIIVPTPPNALDFASSAQFWSLFADLTGSFTKSIPALKQKRYDFINVLLAKTDQTKTATNIVREWIRKTYTDLVLPIEISSTGGVLAAAAQFGTVYDISSYSGPNKGYQRSREEYDALAELIDLQFMALWTRGGNNNGE